MKKILSYLIILSFCFLAVEIAIDVFKFKKLAGIELAPLKVLNSMVKTSETFDEKGSLSENVLRAFNLYPDAMDVIKTGNLKLPVPEHMVPQGITKVGSYTLITAYDEQKKVYSECYIIDDDGNEVNSITLDIKSHVGSIAYDSVNNLVWIPDSKGSLNAYDFNDILKEKEVHAKYRVDIGINLKNKFSDGIDYLCVDGNLLYAGNFSQNGKGIVRKYSIEWTQGNISLKFINDFLVPSQVQGISFYHRDNQDYMIISQSFGRNNDSNLIVFKYEENVRDYNEGKSIKLPPLLEQNAVYGKDLYIIFESGAKKYRDGKSKIDCVCVLDIEKILEKCF